jgi:UDP-3-O-[3-hydroxymyristoyl] glucosamine N-acyltransferase
MISLGSLQEYFKTLTCVSGSITEITGLNQLSRATETEATFLIDHRYRSQLKECHAAVLITQVDEFSYVKDEFKGTVWHTPDPIDVLGHLASVLELQKFGEDERWQEPGIHPTAIVEAGAKVHPKASIGPYCVVRKDAVIEEDVSLMAYVYIGCHAHIKLGCTIGVGASILAYSEIGSQSIVLPGAVIGSQGFGVLRNKKKQNTRIPQLGRAVVGPQVRVGCNATIDRSTFGETKIGARSFLDNQTQVGHNAEAGEDLILCAQSGLTGSSKIGDRVTIAALSGVKDHVTLGDDVTLAAFTGVVKDWLIPNTVLKGYPAEPVTDHLKKLSLFRALPKLLERIKVLEAEVHKLKEEKKVETHIEC